MAAPTSTTAPPSATSTASSSSGGGSGPSSPLLFFVALGFGVVFTNLWIIVGVKYCFRYNQRNRQRQLAEDGEGVDLGAMPRAHRRRREKKLMSMEEVNERFPLTKYKTWRSTRAEEGLPTAGGITAGTAPSRPASIKHEAGASKEEETFTNVEPEGTATNAEEKKHTLEHGVPEYVGGSTTEPHPPEPSTSTDDRPTTAQSSDVPVTKVTTNEDEVEDDDPDQIQPTVPAEQLPDPGDACAICLDTIEDDDDIRGLDCGHAFHASCVDPWLTSRRACCPLCKADYYVPKPRPEGSEAGEERRRGLRTEGIMPAPPQFAFMGAGRGSLNPFGSRGGDVPRRPTMVLPGRFMTVVYNENDRYGFPQVVRQPRPSRAERRAERDRQRELASATTATQGTEIAQEPPPTWRQRFASVSSRVPSLIPPMPSFTRTGYGYGENHGDERARARSEVGIPGSPAATTPARMEEGRA